MLGKKAVIYCRVSTSKQMAEGNGLSSQQTRCRQYAESNGYNVVAVFNDDASGSLFNREGMKALLKYLRRQKEEHVVIIDDISRLARDILTHVRLKLEITSAGGSLESPSLKFGDDPDSVTFEQIQAILAQHGRLKNREQVIHRMKARMQNGYWVFNPPTGFGYSVVPGHGKVMSPVEPYASTVREVYEGYASGRFETLSEIVRYLKQHPGWPSEARKSLNYARVRELMSRPHYAGYIDYPEWGIQLVPARHAPIISFTTYQAVQDRIRGAAKAPARRDINEGFPLRGYIACEPCGNPMSACYSKGRNAHYPYYICKTKGCPEYSKSFRREKVEEQFNELLEGVQPNVAGYEVFKAALKLAWDNRLGSIREQVRLFEGELQKIEKAIEQFLDRLVSTDSPTLISTYETKIKNLEIEKIEVREKMQNYTTIQESFDSYFRTGLEFLKNPIKLWASDDMADKRTVLKLVFAEPIKYARIGGFRTAEITKPFKVINDLAGGEVAYGRYGGPDRD